MNRKNKNLIIIVSINLIKRQKKVKIGKKVCLTIKMIFKLE